MTRDLRSSRAYGVFIGAVSALASLTTPSADAASPPITAQAAAANAAFLAYAPPPAGGAKALCLVDTGVNPTADTAPGLVFATAIDGGTPNDVDPLWHGTIDAAIAGGVGHGVLGAWPQVKIVSVRATSVPSPGQHATFQFDDYDRGITRCATIEVPGVQIAAIALPLASRIPPSPDQAAEFTAAVNRAQASDIAILAAAGNEPGAVQLPGNQPGILPVGAVDASNSLCPFSASSGLTLYAPGCGIDQIDTQGNAFCCGNGTSQASVFAAAGLVALRSYKPEFTGAQAVQQLVATARNGHLDLAGAFRAAGLGTIVDAGMAAIPRGGQPTPTVSPPPTVRRVPRPSVKRVIWRRGVLEIVLRSIPKGARLHAKMTFARRKSLYIGTSRMRIRVRMPKPRRVDLHQSRGGASSVTVHATVSSVR